MAVAIRTMRVAEHICAKVEIKIPAQESENRVLQAQSILPLIVRRFGLEHSLVHMAAHRLWLLWGDERQWVHTKSLALGCSLRNPLASALGCRLN